MIMTKDDFLTEISMLDKDIKTAKELAARARRRRWQLIKENKKYITEDFGKPGWILVKHFYHGWNKWQWVGFKEISKKAGFRTQQEARALLYSINRKYRCNIYIN